MSTDVENAYEVESLIVGSEPNLIGIFSGGVLPHIAVPDAPMYSMYYRSTGEVYRLTNAGGGNGSLAGDWEQGATFNPLYEFIQDQTVTSTNSSTFISKLQLVSSDLTAANYRIQIQYGWQFSNTSFSFESEVVLDGVSQEVHSQKPTDSTDTHFLSRAFLLENHSGVLTIDLNFRSTKAGKTASMFSALIDLRRIQ